MARTSLCIIKDPEKKYEERRTGNLAKKIAGMGLKKRGKIQQTRRVWMFQLHGKDQKGGFQ